MNYKRIGRLLVCLVLVCCLMVQMVPARADATAAGLVGTITGVSSVSVSAPVALGAMAIALGVMVGTNDDFHNLVTTAASSGFEWVKDGSVELLRTVDELGNQTFYAAGEMLEGLRSTFFDSDVISSAISDSFQLDDDIALAALSCPYSAIVVRSDMNGAVYYARSNSPFYESTSSGYKVLRSDSNWYYWISTGDSWASCKSTNVLWCHPGVQSSYYTFGSASSVDYFETSYDLSLGYIPTYSLDGTVQDDAFRDYMSKQIRLQNQDNPDDPEGDESNSNWFLPLSLGAAASVFATTQAQQWLGQTSSDFDEYENVAVYPDFRVDSKTDTGLDFDTIVIAPMGIPDSGGSTNPDDGGDDVVVPPDASLLEGLFGGLESKLDDIYITFQEIPGLLRELFADIKTSIVELPSKFAEWFENIQTALQELIAGQITIGQLLGEFLSPLIEAFRTLLQSLFVPSSSFVSNKVDSLVSKYPHFNVFIGLGTQLKTFFLGLGSKPPIIYIDLGAATGSYFFGGRQAFIDLSWYADYKPTMDAILGAFIWLWLAWRIFLMLPGIINGSSGAAGSLVRYSERSMKSQDGGADR